jgi:tripartite-type tricarboxylate transporter receptor subunit TctC
MRAQNNRSKHMIRRFSRATAAWVLGLVALTAQAQSFPNKPVRLVIPFAPGGSTDANARIIQDKLSTLWGQPLVIDTKPGANTIIGTDLVAKSPGDGYTLLLTSTAYVVNPSMYQKLPYDPMNDFIPVTMVSVFFETASASTFLLLTIASTASPAAV